MLIDDPKRQPPSEGRPLDSITMCTIGRMIESYFDGFKVKRCKKYLGKPTMENVELTSRVQSSAIEFVGLDIIGPRCSLTSLVTQSDVTLVRSTMTSFTKLWDTSIQWSARLKCEAWMWSVLLVPHLQKDIIYLGYNWLFLQISRNGSPEGGQDIWRNQICQASRHLPLQGTKVNCPQ